MSNLSDVVGGANMYNGASYSFAYDRFCNFNSAIYIAGSSLSVPASVVSSFFHDFTVIVWLYLKKSYQNNLSIIWFANSNGNSLVDTIFLGIGSPGCLQISIQINASIGKSVNTGSLIQLNQWYHVAYVLNGTVGYIYLNGSLAATGTLFVPKSVNRYYNQIGSNSSVDQTYDDLKIYQGALSATQILNDYAVSSNNGNFLLH